MLAIKEEKESDSDRSKIKVQLERLYTEKYKLQKIEKVIKAAMGKIQVHSVQLQVEKLILESKKESLIKEMKSSTNVAKSVETVKEAATDQQRQTVSTADLDDPNVVNQIELFLETNLTEGSFMCEDEEDDDDSDDDDT